MSNLTKQEQADYDAAFTAMAEYERQIDEHNAKVLRENNIRFEDFECLVDDVRVTDKIEIVDKPSGTDNNEDHARFKRIFVKQWSVGDSGDSYEGLIFAELEENKWLQIPYDC